MTTFLGGSNNTQSQSPVAARGLTVQSSVYGAPLAKGYGTNRVAGNLIWYGDFTSSTGGGQSGKGGTSASGGGGTTYTASFNVAVGCGPIFGMRKFWVDKNVYDTLAIFDPNNKVTIFDGTYPQSPWSYLANEIIPSDGSISPVQDHNSTYSTNRTYFIMCSFTSAAGETLANTEVSYLVTNNFSSHNLLVVQPPTNFPPNATGWNIYVSLTTGTEKKQNTTPMSPTTSWKEVTTGLANHGNPPASDTSNLSQALNYNGIAYLAKKNEGLGTNPSLGNINIEVQWGSFVSGLDDADASLVIADMLTNVHDGIQFPSGFLASTTDLQNYVLSAGLLISPVFTQQQAIAQTITDLCKNINIAPIWTAGKLSFIPYGDTAISGNGKSWTPPISVFNFTDDDFQPNTYASGTAGGGSSNNDPVIITRPDQSKVVSSITLEYYDRTNNYNPATVQYKNLALINQFGETPDQSARDGHLFCLAAAAQVAVALQGNRELGRNIYQWTLDQRGILYDPMDWGYISITESGTVYQVPVRILEITENDDGTFTFMAEDYLQGTGHAPAQGQAAGNGFVNNFNEDPGNTNVPVIFEAPAAITTNGGLETWMAISGAVPSTWGGCQIMIATNAVDYGYAGTQTGPSRQGLLVSSISSSDTTMTINLAESQGALTSGTAGDATAGTTLCYLDGEFISYQTATLIAPFQYTLTGCVRGFYGSKAVAHAAGVQFARLDGQIFKYQHAKLQNGQTLSIKLLSFNIFGGGQQSP